MYYYDLFVENYQYSSWELTKHNLKPSAFHMRKKSYGENFTFKYSFSNLWFAFL